MVAPLRVGIAGLGTVGAEVVRLIEEQARTLSARSGRGVRVVAVTARSKAKKRSVNLRGVEWAKSPLALANDPKIILADEPTGNLDTANSERAFELLQNIVQEGGKALLLATHNPVIAEACDWTHEMKDGLINASHPRGARRR